MSFPIALQLYSVRDDMAKDFAGTLKKVKEFGYDGVEFAGLFEYKPEEVKEILKESGLSPVSAHVPFDDLIADTQKVVSAYAEIGCKYIAIPYLSPEYRPGAEKFNEVIEGAKTIGKIAKEFGIQLLYHNHDFEFEKINGEYALDVLYKSFSSELLQTEIDTCWVNVAGENPSDYIRKYIGRSPVVHLKDFVRPGDKKEDETKVFEFRPLGLGVQNFSEILKACKDAGASWVIVEQDAPSMGKTPLECVQTSINYLKSI